MTTDNNYWNQQQGAQPQGWAQPAVGQQAGQQPRDHQQGWTQSAAQQPVGQQSAARQPVGQQQDWAQQAVQQQGAQRQGWTQLSAQQPVAQLAAQQPTAQPAAQPAAQQPAAQPAVQQPAAQQPAAQPVSQQPQDSTQPTAQRVAGTSGAAYAPPQPPINGAAYASQQPGASNAVYAAEPRKKSRGWIVAIVVIVCLFAFTAFCVKACTDSVSSLSPSMSKTSVSDLTRDAIGIIDIDGTIQYDGSACSPEGLKELLDEARDSDYVKAIVLRVNSGGGTAAAGEEMATYLREFEKPVVVSSASINASAAYEISSQADYIYVAKSTEIGAIGTVIEMTNLSGLFEKLGIDMEVITSAESKDSTYGYRALTDDEREYYRKMVEQINDTFIENVATGRKMQVADVKKLATGLVFTGTDAVSNGLADAIGTREDAVKKAAELAGVTDYETASLYLSNYDISSLATLLGGSSSASGDLADALKGEQTVRIK